MTNSGAVPLNPTNRRLIPTHICKGKDLADAHWQGGGGLRGHVLTGWCGRSWNRLGDRMAGAKKRRKMKLLTAVYLTSWSSEETQTSPLRGSHTFNARPNIRLPQQGIATLTKEGQNASSFTFNLMLKHGLYILPRICI